MNALLERVAEDRRAPLRQQFLANESKAWVLEIARRESWSEANKQFLRQERSNGLLEMRLLMSEVGAEAPVEPDLAADLVEAALALHFEDADRSSVRRMGPSVIRLRTCNCPTYRRLETNGWKGVTACGSWHRRQGWYEALGALVLDSVLSESKWGDAACEAMIAFYEAWEDEAGEAAEA